MKKALILLSGGLDSTVMLALANERGLNCIALSFDYGQRHLIELTYAKKTSQYYGIEHHVVKIYNEAFNTSSLMEACAEKPTTNHEKGIPNTYVPARNTLFLAYALSFAEMLKADEIHFGANAADLEGYPDCRPEYFAAYRQLIQVATKQSTTEASPSLVTPLLYWDKKRIFAEARRLNVPVNTTFSCYSPTPDNLPCLNCLACRIRQEGSQ